MPSSVANSSARVWHDGIKVNESGARSGTAAGRSKTAGAPERGVTTTLGTVTIGVGGTTGAAVIIGCAVDSTVSLTTVSTRYGIGVAVPT